MKTVILCGNGKWANAVSQEINSSTNVNIKFCDSSQSVDFPIWKKVIMNSHIIVAEVDSGTDTMLQILTMAQCLNKVVIGLYSATEGACSKFIQLCDDLCDTDSDSNTTIYESIEQFL